MNNSDKITRRQVVSGFGAGIAAAVVSPALGATNLEVDKIEYFAPEDPTMKYPKPPFKQQTQPWPALASKMEP